MDFQTLLACYRCYAQNDDAIARDYRLQGKHAMAKQAMLQAGIWTQAANMLESTLIRAATTTKNQNPRVTKPEPD